MHYVIHAYLPNQPNEPAHVYLVRSQKARPAHEEAARQYRKEQRLASNIFVQTVTLFADTTEALCKMFMQKLAEEVSPDA